MLTRTSTHTSAHSNPCIVIYCTQWICTANGCVCMPLFQGKSEQEAKEVGGQIFTFGSYRLGVHSKGMLPFSCVSVAILYVDQECHYQVLTLTPCW